MMSRDLTDSRWMFAKAIGFIIIGLLASTLIFLELPRWDILALLVIAIWAFARAYYFAFYVVEHYVDPSFRYAGFIDMLKYGLMKLHEQRSNGEPKKEETAPGPD